MRQSSCIVRGQNFYQILTQFILIIDPNLSLIHISEPTRPRLISYAVFCLKKNNLRVGLRSKNDKILQETQIYIADTLGELGLWYRLSPVSFVGGSLVNVGGHNPFEPAALGSAILHGPYFYNFEEILSLIHI